MNVQNLQIELKNFVKERGWEKIHSPKNLSMAISVEAGELMEIFQWMDGEYSRTPDEETLDRIRDELADVMIFCIHLANELEFNIVEIIQSKLQRNKKRFPAKEY